MKQENIHSKNKTILVKQNDASNSILKNFNNIRNLDEEDLNELGAYELTTRKGDINIEVEPEELELIERKLKYTNIKKLYLYLTYRMAQDNQRTLKLKINELLELKGQKRKSKTIERLIEDLETLEQIKIINFKANINGDKHDLERSFLFKFGKWTKQGHRYPSYLSVTAGSWADSLIENCQFAYIPTEIFKFNKLEFDIAFNILTRFRNQLSKLKENNENEFTLSVQYMLRNVELNVRKYGSTKMIDNIEEVLDKLEDLNWFSWQYRTSSRDDLPGRNKMNRYRDFVIDFNIEESKLTRAYNGI